MFGFKQFLIEAKAVAGIQHLEHPADHAFDGPEATNKAIGVLKSVAHGQLPITRKIDDRMSFHAIRHEDGKVGVKYKGPGSSYNYSNKDIERQHGDKEHVKSRLKPLLAHLGKVLPRAPGEYQGGYMSAPGERHETETHIGHTPNTVSYQTPWHSPEGEKLAKSKVSVAIHTTLHGPEKTPKPITDMAGFQHHDDVHIVPHLLGQDEKQPHQEHRDVALDHISKAAALNKDHDHEHLVGHSEHLRTYYNSTVRNGTKPSVDGYVQHLNKITSKNIDSVKTPEAKKRKAAAGNSLVAGVARNERTFDRTFKIHGHLQAATDHLAKGLDKSTARSGWQASINGKPSGGEGYVAGGMKIVDRQAFSKANFANAEKFKKKT